MVCICCSLFSSVFYLLPPLVCPSELEQKLSWGQGEAFYCSSALRFWDFLFPLCVRSPVLKLQTLINHHGCWELNPQSSKMDKCSALLSHLSSNGAVLRGKFTARPGGTFLIPARSLNLRPNKAVQWNPISKQNRRRRRRPLGSVKKRKWIVCYLLPFPFGIGLFLFETRILSIYYPRDQINYWIYYILLKTNEMMFLGNCVIVYLWIAWLM